MGDSGLSFLYAIGPDQTAAGDGHRRDGTRRSVPLGGHANRTLLHSGSDSLPFRYCRSASRSILEPTLTTCPRTGTTSEQTPHLPESFPGTRDT